MQGRLRVHRHRLHYADFLGEQVWERCEKQCPGLGPYEADHMYGNATTPAADGGPQDRQECVGVMEKLGRDLFDCLLAHEVLVDTGRKAVLGYHKDCRVCRIPFEFEDYGCPAPQVGIAEIMKKLTHDVQVHKL
jgi:hypothetical protein